MTEPMDTNNAFKLVFERCEQLHKEKIELEKEIEKLKSNEVITEKNIKLEHEIKMISPPVFDFDILKEKALQQAIKMKHINIVKYLLNYYNRISDFNAYKLLIYINDLEGVEKLLKQRICVISEDNINDIFEYACLAGNVETIKYLYDNYRTIIMTNNDYIEILSREGHIDAVKYLITTYKFYNNIKRASRAAASRGHLEIMQFLKTQGSQSIDNTRLDVKVAIEGGYLNVVKYFMPNAQFSYDEQIDILTDAIIHNQLEIVKWIMEDIKPHNEAEKALNIAIEHDHLDIIEYLLTWC